MKADNVSFLSAEMRASLGKELGLTRCEKGFMDLHEGVSVSDAFALAVFFEKQAQIPTKITMDLFEELVSNIPATTEG